MRVGILGGFIGGLLLLGTPAEGQEGNAPVKVTLHEVEVSVTASSVLKDAKDADRYSPVHLLDEDPGSIWAEGAEGTGAGEWVELGFAPGAPVDAFLVTPGNSKSPALYRANARPRKARLELKLEDRRRVVYELEFPRNAPAGYSLYVDYGRPFAVQSARLTVLSAWPGTKYRDLCLGTFVPVFQGPDRTFRGQGKELAPTLSWFMRQALLVYKLLPPEESDEPTWFRTYENIPHDGPLLSPVREFNPRIRNLSNWGDELYLLAEDVAASYLRSQLFRLVPTRQDMEYTLDPTVPPKSSSEEGNFRIRWRFLEGQWRVVEIDMKYREETPP